MTLIRFTVPGTPVAKGRPRFAPSGHAYTPAKTRSYEDAVRLYARRAMAGKKMLTGPVELRVTLYFPKKATAETHTKKPDWDNLGKIISDACNMIVYHDDAQVTDSHVCKRYSAEPRAVVVIREIEEETNGGAF